MALVINKTPEKGYKYILEDERGVEKPFAVWLKPLPVRDFLDLEDHMVERKDGGVIIAQGVFSFKIAQQSIVGWENISDENGADLKFVKGVDGIGSPDLIASIPAHMITEIASVVNAVTRDSANIKIFFPED